MTNKTGPSIFFSSDKNMYDILKQSSLTEKKLLDFLRHRGIFLSQMTDKEEIILCISRRCIDLRDRNELLELMGARKTKEPLASIEIKSENVNLEKKEIISALKKLKNQSEEMGEICQINNYGKTATANIKSEIIDYSRTELLQKKTQDIKLEFQESDEGFIIRYPSNEKASVFVDDFLGILESKTKKEILPTVISLDFIPQPETRSFFFQRLIQLIEGYDFHDVISVDIHHKSSVPDLEAEGDFLDEENTSGESPSRHKEYSQDATGYIRRAILTGTGVLESREFNQLHQNDFFISRIVWTAVSNKKSKSEEKIELEAQFKEPKSCRKFSYSCKGLYKAKDVGFIKTRKNFSALEEKRIIELLEKAARTAFQDVIAKHGDTTEDESV